MTVPQTADLNQLAAAAHKEDGPGRRDPRVLIKLVDATRRDYSVLCSRASCSEVCKCRWHKVRETAPIVEGFPTVEE
jgi:hypothetical protein